MKIKNFLIILVFFSLSLNNLFSMEPDIFVQSTVNRASAILGDNISKEKKIEELAISSLNPLSFLSFTEKTLSWISLVSPICCFVPPLN